MEFKPLSPLFTRWEIEFKPWWGKFGNIIGLFTL